MGTSLLLGCASLIACASPPPKDYPSNFPFVAGGVPTASAGSADLAEEDRKWKRYSLRYPRSAATTLRRDLKAALVKQGWFIVEQERPEALTDFNARKGRRRVSARLKRATRPGARLPVGSGGVVDFETLERLARQRARASDAGPIILELEDEANVTPFREDLDRFCRTVDEGIRKYGAGSDEITLLLAPSKFPDNYPLQNMHATLQFPFETTRILEARLRQQGVGDDWRCPALDDHLSAIAAKSPTTQDPAIVDALDARRAQWLRCGAERVPGSGPVASVRVRFIVPVQGGRPIDHMIARRPGEPRDERVEQCITKLLRGVAFAAPTLDSLQAMMRTPATVTYTFDLRPAPTGR